MAAKTTESDAAPAPAAPRAIRLDAPGIVAVGPYRAGRAYRVPEDIPADEARRLIEVKGFKEVTR